MYEERPVRRMMRKMKKRTGKNHRSDPKTGLFVTGNLFFEFSVMVQKFIIKFIIIFVPYLFPDNVDVNARGG